MIGRTKVLAATAAALVAVTTIAVASTGNDDEGTVIRVIDGDTLLVDFDDQELTVRLLNVDTPETKDPDKPVECMGPEATDFLTEALPEGSTVTLAFDVEREDRYGRTLAAVYDDEDLLINAEVARRGLGVPVTYEPNSKFRPPVDEAYQEAQEQQAGLFAEDIECTVPAMVAALENTAAQAAALQDTGSTAATAAASAAAVLVLAKLVDEGFDALEAATREGRSIMWAALSESEKAVWKARADEAKDTVHTHHGDLVALQEERQNAENEVIRKAEAKAEADRVAAQAEAERVAAAQAEADRIAAEAEANRRAAAVPPAPTYNPPPEQTYNPPPAQNVNPPGYTGPRCYAPGGKSWRPC
ncbi:thermonuclease family protein [Arthrobacter gengyunqii]|uniref:Thermonuclease family protein n=1 Tax=Arthrobacter gengyunqii TaxID=2886940 RepID=A0A9X1M4T6_9MICC|nr:thermonuclease family protein [Arthrobacter gengyunqii]MCC3271051.1 thermonuclease family protein [Arthrobacter gengyunqii]UOY96779.1 thermonuclease family protein [Arthrobacter gengyunqii]